MSSFLVWPCDIPFFFISLFPPSVTLREDQPFAKIIRSLTFGVFDFSASLKPCSPPLAFQVPNFFLDELGRRVTLNDSSSGPSFLVWENHQPLTFPLLHTSDFIALHWAVVRTV